MESKIKKVKKSVNGDRIFIRIVLVVMTVIAINTTSDIVRYSLKSAESFEVKMVDEGSFKGYYCLYIDGENFNTIDYNEYVSSVDEKGNTNIKMCVIIQEVGTLVRTIFIGIIFNFAYLILDNIFEPFSKKNIMRLRIMAVLTMLLAIMPAIIMNSIKMIYFYNINIGFSQINFFVMMIGVLLGVISEVFKYGHELQEEIEQIA